MQLQQGVSPNLVEALASAVPGLRATAKLADIPVVLIEQLHAGEMSIHQAVVMKRHK
jgi:hypothetical protein